MSLIVDPDQSVETAARLMIKHKIGAVPAVQNGRVAGIVSTKRPAAGVTQRNRDDQADRGAMIGRLMARRITSLEAA